MSDQTNVWNRKVPVHIEACIVEDADEGKVREEDLGQRGRLTLYDFAVMHRPLIVLSFTYFIFGILLLLLLLHLLFLFHLHLLLFQVKEAILSFLRSRTPVFRLGAIDTSSDPELAKHVQSLAVADFGMANIAAVSYWRADLLLHIYTLFDDQNQEGLSFTLNENDEIASFTTLLCPNTVLDGVWESIHVNKRIKDVLSMITHSALTFSIQGVDPRLITGNKVGRVGQCGKERKSKK